MTNRIINFGLFVFLIIGGTMFICAQASAQEPFIGFGIDLEHHKHETNLCYSGGFSRNMTFSGKVMAGIESNDVRMYMFYKNSKCVLNGDLRDPEDHWRADQVITRDESIGFTFEWKTNL